MLLRNPTGPWWLATALFALTTAPQARSQEASPSSADAREAMTKAVTFFADSASVHGGYVYRWSADLSLCEGEEAVGPDTAWIQPPATPAVGMAYLDAYRLTGEPLLRNAAQATAQALIRGQLMSGGWDGFIEFDPAARKKHAYRVDGGDVGKRRNVTTFDDDKSQSAIRFLVELDRELEFKDAALHEAAQYALDGVLQAQYPNGAWPQRYERPADPDAYPIKRASIPDQWSRTFPAGKYGSYYTLNDGTISDLITTLLLATDVYGEDRYREAALRGGDFLLLAQLPEPQPGWAQQYDAAMQPSWARKFEPPAVTGSESQTAMRTLIALYRRTGERRFIESLPRALDYYRTCLLPDGKLARFYELQTNKPLYFTRDYEITYSPDDLPTHYAFIVKSNLDRIAQELQEVQKLPREKLGQSSARIKPPKLTPQLAKDAARAIEALDHRGAWVESGRLRSHEAAKVDQVIQSETFIRNLRTLSQYVSAAASQ